MLVCSPEIARKKTRCSKHIPFSLSSGMYGLMVMAGLNKKRKILCDYSRLNCIYTGSNFPCKCCSRFDGRTFPYIQCTVRDSTTNPHILRHCANRLTCKSCLERHHMLSTKQNPLELSRWLSCLNNPVLRWDLTRILFVYDTGQKQ